MKELPLKESGIKILLWDIDGTLLNFELAEAAAIRTCFAEFDLGICSDEMLADYSKINKSYWERLERGEITKPQVLLGRFLEFFAKYGLDTAKAPAFNDSYQIRLGDTCVFYPNAMETVLACKNICRQYAVTNGTKIAQTKKLNKSGLIRVLDGVFISEDVGKEKPTTEYFDRIFEQIAGGIFKNNITKDQVLIIGDSLTSDITGGNNAGIRTCWFNPENKPNTHKELRIDYEIRDLKELKNILPILVDKEKIL